MREVGLEPTILPCGCLYVQSGLLEERGDVQVLFFKIQFLCLYQFGYSLKMAEEAGYEPASACMYDRVYPKVR